MVGFGDYALPNHNTLTCNLGSVSKWYSMTSGLLSLSFWILPSWRHATLRFDGQDDKIRSFSVIFSAKVRSMYLLKNSLLLTTANFQNLKTWAASIRKGKYIKWIVWHVVKNIPRRFPFKFEFFIIWLTHRLPVLFGVLSGKWWYVACRIGLTLSAVNLVLKTSSCSTRSIANPVLWQSIISH